MKLHISGADTYTQSVDIHNWKFDVATGNEVRIMTPEGKYYLRIGLIEHRLDYRGGFQADPVNISATIAVNRTGTKQEVDYLAGVLAKLTIPS